MTPSAKTNGYPPTAKLSPHARERATEMAVSTKRVKRMVANPDTRHTCHDHRWFVTSEQDPEIAVVYALDADGTPIVITVLWRTDEQYTRAAAS